MLGMASNAEQAENKARETKWTQSDSICSEPFIEKIKQAIGFRARGRKIHRTGHSFELHEAL